MHGLSTASSPYKVPKGDCLGSADNQNTINNGLKTQLVPSFARGRFRVARFSLILPFFLLSSSLLFYPPVSFCAAIFQPDELKDDNWLNQK